jgi:hypothetical protein
MNAKARAETRSYFAKPDPKALAFSPETGNNRYVWGTVATSSEEAAQLALDHCEERTGTRCELFAVNNEIVWQPPPGAGTGAATAAADMDTGLVEQGSARAGDHLVGTFDLRGGRGAVLQVINPTGQELLLLAAFYDGSGTPLRCRSQRLPADGLAEVDVRKEGVKTSLGVVRVVAVAEGRGRPVAGLISGTPGLQPAPVPLRKARLTTLGQLCDWRPGGPTLNAGANPSEAGLPMASRPAVARMVTAPPPPISAPAVGNGRFVIHVASVRDPVEVPDEWRRLAKRHPSLAGLALQPPQPIDVPGRGVFYRILLGAFATRAEAQSACISAQAGGGYCAVVTP